MDLLLLPYCHHLQCILGTKVYLYFYYIYIMLYIQDLNELHTPSSAGKYSRNLFCSLFQEK